MKQNVIYEIPTAEIVSLEVEGQVFTLSGDGQVDDMYMDEW